MYMHCEEIIDLRNGMDLCSKRMSLFKLVYFAKWNSVDFQFIKFWVSPHIQLYELYLGYYLHAMVRQYAPAHPILLQIELCPTHAGMPWFGDMNPRILFCANWITGYASTHAGVPWFGSMHPRILFWAKLNYASDIVQVCMPYASMVSPRILFCAKLNYSSFPWVPILLILIIE